MHPILRLYLAIKKRETGVLRFTPVDVKDFGVIKVELQGGEITGFDSTWGASLKNLSHMLNWRNAVVKALPVGSENTVKVHVPRSEALKTLVELEMENLPPPRDISPEEAKDLLNIRIGKRQPISEEDVRRIKEGENNGRSFFLQRNNSHASIFLAGKEIYTFTFRPNRVERIPLKDFLEDDVFIINVDHIVALAVSTLLFTEGKPIDGKDVPIEVERLKKNYTSIWHVILSSIGDLYVSILGYRGAVLGVFMLLGDDVKMKGEKDIKTIVSALNLEGRVYEYASAVRGS